MSLPGRRLRDGARFRTLLIGLFVIPVVLATVLLSAVTISLTGRVNTADRTVAALDVEARIGTAQAALLAEIIPTLAPAYVSRAPQLGRPGLRNLAEIGIDAFGYDPANTAALRAATDQALAAVDVEPARMAEVGRALAGVRQAGEQPGTRIAEPLGRFTQVSTLLGSIEVDQQLLIARSGHSARLASDVKTAQTVRALATSTDFERGLVLAALVFDDQELREQWAAAWGHSAALTADLEAFVVAGGPVAEAWTRTRETPSLQRAEQRSAAFFASGMQAKQTVSIAELADLLRAVGDLETSSRAYTQLLDAANGQVRAEVLEQRADAVRALWLVLAAAALCAVPLLLVSVALLRSVTRPLARLAEDAREISEGVLVDVGIGGPREVRSVGRALHAAVATLRQVQSQAEAFSKGDLEAAVLSQGVPGPLGAVLHETMEAALVSVQESDRLRQDMAHLAAHDGLTGLPNRVEVLRVLGVTLEQARDTGSSVALLFLDLDHFKQVNDGFGHRAGDTVLLEVSRRLLSEVREDDTVGRLGGDEFVVVVASREETALVELAERLVAVVGGPIDVADRSVTVGASIGVAISRGGVLGPSTLLSEADAAAYRAKSAGRGRVDVFDDALRQELHERAELERAMAAGLVGGEFVLHYQPITILGSGATVGFEALVRWERPGHGLVPPMSFIPIAEQSTLVCDLGRWVLHEAMRQLAAWDEAGHRFDVGINVSGRHFAAGRLVEDVRDALAATGVDPAQIVLELTETVAAGDGDVHEQLAELRAMGLRIALDDFGTGFTSIGQLQRLPVDVIKIDRSFVIASDDAGRELLSLMTRAAHAYSLAVVAEGIETSEQLAMMTALGCDAGQGYLFARPLPADEALGLALARP
jgi:diguanylate cyclase (GGDEF)-like protein